MIATAPATCMAEWTARIDSHAATRIPRMAYNLVLPEASVWKVTGLDKAGWVRTWAPAVC